MVHAILDQMREREADRSQPIWHWFHWLVAVPASVLLAVELERNRSFWLDETYTARASQLPWKALVDQTSGTDVHSIVYYGAAKVWISVWGMSEMRLRLLSVVCTVAALFVIYRTTLRLADRAVASLTVSVLMVCPLVFRLATTARGYGMLLLLGSVATALLVRVIDRPTLGGWVAYAAVLPPFIFTHLTAAFLVVGHWAMMLVVRKRLDRRALIGVGTSFGSLAILALLLRRSDENPVSFLGAPGLRSFSWLGDSLVGSHWVAVLVACGAAVSLWLGVRAGALRSIDRRLVACAVVPPVALVAISPLKSLLIDRYWTAILPCMVATVVAVVVAAARQPSVVPRLAAGAVAVCFAGGAAFGLINRPVYFDQDWRGAVHQLAGRVAGGDVLITPNTEDRSAMDFYVLRQGALGDEPPVFPEGPWGAVPLNRLWPNPSYAETSVASAIAGHSRVWMVEGRQGGIPSTEALAALAANGYGEITSFHTTSDIRILVRLFEK